MTQKFIMMSMSHNKNSTSLFKLNKNGKPMIFTIKVAPLGTGWVVITKKGQLGGTMQEDVEVVDPKNTGRANETTPEQQARLQAKSKVSKLMDKGYKLLEDSEGKNAFEIKRNLLKSEGTDAKGNNLVMLAQKHIRRITLPGYAQRKYDGMRGVIKKIDGVYTLRSRNGKFLANLDHILNDVVGLPDGWELDGELYCHGKSIQDIVSMAKRKQAANALILFRCYDAIIPNMTYENRRKEVKKIVLRSGPSIVYVATHLVRSWEDIMEWFHKWKNTGYEGLMWRDPKGLYETGRRSYGLIKVKDFLEQEFKIIDVKEATGRDAGTAVFICRVKPGLTVDIRPMGDRSLRRDYFENFEKYRGKDLTVRFQSWTKDGKPFHARGVVIRDYD